MKRFNLEEYLKNPDRKIVTVDLEPARIICTNATQEEPVVAVVEEEVHTFRNNGRFYSDDEDSRYDLYFADEEDGLTELQKTLEEDCDCYVNLYNDGKTREELRGWIKAWCPRIIDLVRKELEKKYRIVDKDDSDWEDAYKQCKQDVLKDLPKWKNVTHDADFCMNARLDEYIINDVLTEHGEVKERWVLKKSDLEKLPKE